MSCFARPNAPNTLFDLGDTKIISHTIEVKPGEVWLINAQGLMDGDCIAVETVSGCGLGDMFESYYSPNEDCPATLTCCQPRMVIPFTGRYRLVIQCGDPGDYRVMAYPTADVGLMEDNMGCGCNTTIQPGAVVDAILASPSALAGLCSGMSDCIAAQVPPPSATITPADIAATARNNPSLFVLVEDAFGVDLGYMFPV